MYICIYMYIHMCDRGVPASVDPLFVCYIELTNLFMASEVLCQKVERDSKVQFRNSRHFCTLKIPKLLNVAI